jgi:colicin import membrane protein
MSEVAEVESTELDLVPPAETALEVYQQPKGLDPYIERIRAEVTGHAPDITTRKGREAIASLAFKVRRAKSALDALGKEQVDRLKEIPKKIDAERKRMRETLDALADEVRRPLDEWERAEEARVARLKSGVEWFHLRAEENRDLDSAELRASIEEVGARVVDESWEEFEAEAHRMKARALDSLTQALAAREKYEAEQAELVRLREAEAQRLEKEREERIAREAAEDARREAEAKAQAEREASAQREAQAKAAAEKAERERLEAIERQKQAEARAEAERLAAEQRARDAAEAARLAEIQRQADEAARIEAEQKAREADRAHKAKTNNVAVAALVAGGLTAEAAKLAVTLIAQGKVPAVRINY